MNSIDFTEDHKLLIEADYAYPYDYVRRTPTLVY